jgi:chaperonin GroES
MNVRPLHDRLIVQRLEESAARAGAIIIPDSAKEKPQQGKVLAAGLGKSDKDGKRVPLDVTAGDIVLFGKYSGQEIKLDGLEYLIMKEDDVLAIEDARPARNGGAKTKGSRACVRSLGGVRFAPLFYGVDNGQPDYIRR